MTFLIDEYDKQVAKLKSHLLEHPRAQDYKFFYVDKIKWSRDLKKKFVSLKTSKLSSEELFIKCNYRPFTVLEYYSEKIFSDVLTSNHYEFFGKSLNLENKVITISSGQRAKFSVLATDKISGLDFYLPNST